MLWQSFISSCIFARTKHLTHTLSLAKLRRMTNSNTSFLMYSLYVHSVVYVRNLTIDLNTGLFFTFASFFTHHMHETQQTFELESVFTRFAFAHTAPVSSSNFQNFQWDKKTPVTFRDSAMSSSASFNVIMGWEMWRIFIKVMTLKLIIKKCNTWIIYNLCSKGLLFAFQHIFEPVPKKPNCTVNCQIQHKGHILQSL